MVKVTNCFCCMLRRVSRREAWWVPVLALPLAFAMFPGPARDWLEAGSRYEYPAYGLYALAIPWVVTAACVAFLSLPHSRADVDDAADTSPAEDTAASFWRRRFTNKRINTTKLRARWPPVWLRRLCAFAAPGALVFVGLSPYFGVRTYSALAMFSNLRVEGCRGNHLFMPQFTSALDDTVEIIDTDLASLRHFTVDLADLYAPSTRSFLQQAETVPALWICPPRWTAGNLTDFAPFSIPIVEFQRVVAGAAAPFYVEYRHNGCDSAGRGPHVGPVWWLEHDSEGSKRIGNDLAASEEEAAREMCAIEPAMCPDDREKDDFAEAKLGWLDWFEGFTSYRAFDAEESVCRH